jgi:hypothetical protein
MADTELKVIVKAKELAKHGLKNKRYFKGCEKQ